MQAYDAEAPNGWLFRPVIASEYQRIPLERMAEPTGYLKSPLDLTVDGRIEIKRAEEAGSARSTISHWSGQTS